MLQEKTVEHFARVTSTELPHLLRSIDAYEGKLVRLAMQLLCLVFLRTKELTEAQWSEFNIPEARWDIPKERMKGRRTPHIVPLSRQAVAILADLWESRMSEVYVFPGERENPTMNKNTILNALEKMGYKGKQTGHGFRGIASTILHELGYEHEHIELQLHHVEQDDVSAAYNFAKYLDQRRKMMQDWADHLDRMREIGRENPFRRPQLQIAHRR